MKKRNTILLFHLLPIIAGILALAGDFLLGYMQKEAIGTFGMVQAGWADVSLWRPALSLFLASLAFPMYLAGLYAVSKQIEETSRKTAKIFLFTSIVSSLGWLFIHAIFCVPQYAYKFLYDAGYPELALKLTNDLYEMVAPPLFICLVSLVIAFAFLFIAIVRKKTIFCKWIALLNPLVIAMVTVPLAFLFPSSAFIYSISVGTLNLGMLLFFIVAAVYKYKSM